MAAKPEEVKELPLVYPLISITLRTVSIVDGRRINNECEEILNMDQLSLGQAAVAVAKLVEEFEAYVSKVVATAGSAQGRRELQSILDTHARLGPQPSRDLPSLPSAPEGQGASMEPSGLPEG